MKKIFSLLLTVAMLLAMVPAVIVTASAETATQTIVPWADYSIGAGKYVIPAVVTSGTTTYAATTETTDPDTGTVTYTVNAMDWSKVPFCNLSSTRYSQNVVASYKDATGATQEASTKVEVVAKFGAPTTVSEIVFRSHYYFQRMKDFSVSLSTDGTNWTQVIAPIPYKATTAANAIVFTLAAEHTTTKWEYIKLERSTAGWVELNGLVCLSTENTMTSGAVRVGATHVASYADSAAAIWSGTNMATVDTKPTDSAAGYWSYAKLDSPTKLDSIVFDTGVSGNRNRGAEIWVTNTPDDAESWVKVGALPSALNDYTRYTVSCATDTAYQYVKIQRTSWSWNISMLNIAVYGTPSGCQMTDTQTKIAEDGKTYSVRLLSKVDSLEDYTLVGYKITATAEGMTDKTWDKNSTTVYTAVMADVDGTPTAVAAGEGKYWFAATIENISIENYADVTFVVEAYVEVEGGVRIYSAPVTVVFNDGVRV